MISSKYIQEFCDEITRKGYRKQSIKNYVSCVTKFLSHFNKMDSPKHINESDIKDYLGSFQDHNTQRANHSAIKCFYRYVIKQPNKFKYIEYAKKSQHLPIILSTQEMQSIINATTNLKHKAIVILMYATGIRVSEVINLKIEDIDSKRMVIYIKDAKGGKDRIVPLPEELLSLLRKYFIEYRPKEFLFNGQFDLRYSARSVNEFLKQCAKRAGISKDIHAHLIRHTSLTHSAESGIDINLIQRIAGHSDPKITSIYLHLSHNHISKTQTPLNAISL